MINFSTLQDLTIPEGVVTQIESGGVVLWSAAKYVTITFIESNLQFGENPQHSSKISSVIINDVEYDGSFLGSISVKAGTVISCYITVEKGTNRGIISVNGEIKVQGTTGKYNHRATENCEISIGCEGYPISSLNGTFGEIVITTKS